MKYMSKGANKCCCHTLHKVDKLYLPDYLIHYWII